MREIALLNINSNYNDNIKNNLIPYLMEFGNITVFKYHNIDNTYDNCPIVELPMDIDTEPKARNYINKYYNKQKQYNGFLHVIIDTTYVITKPDIFIQDIESMMTFFDYNVWFSTVTDTCNYVYNKYVPILSIDLDRPEYALCMSKNINFTSHSNTHWIIYDMSKQLGDLLYFDENYKIAMYWIIEFLARRRNTKKPGQLYFMNKYMTVKSELNTFNKFNIDENIDINTQKYEADLFKNKNINFTPDVNIDALLIDFWNIAKNKKI